jgi:hypothetical protein
MTNNCNRSLAAAAELDRINTELKAALDDFALLERLKSATDRVKRLTAEQEKAIKERDKALAAEAKAAEASRFADIREVTVTEHPETVREHVLRANYTIKYVRLTWDGRTSAPAQRSADGFSALPSDVMDYLIERRPERIPAKIMALAPDRPRDAFNRYFASLRRGHVAG